MKLIRALVVLDVETTGTDPMADRIVQFGAVRMEPDGPIKEGTNLCPVSYPHLPHDYCDGKPAAYRPQPPATETLKLLINPERPIPPEATAIHGITDAQAKAAPPFAAVASQVVAFLTDADYCGYNLRRLDLPILDQELRRCGSKLPLGTHIIDVYGLWAKMMPRTLSDAVYHFCGRRLPDAHDALADAQATLDVLHGQIAVFPPLDGLTAGALAILSNLGDKQYADLAGKLYRDGDGDLRYAFGKVKDEKVRDDTGFGHWMLGKDFAGNTLDVLYAELKRLEKRPDLFEQGPAENIPF